MLDQEIRKRTVKIAVIGLGYVGYPIAALFEKESWLLWSAIQQRTLGVLDET